jgi:acyl-CoA dehydrogenase
LNNIQEAFDGVLRNFPNRLAALFLRAVIFPLGRRFHKPSDKSGHKVAKLFLDPTETRDRVTRGLCLAKDAFYPMGRIDEILKAVIAIEPIEKRIKVAVKEGKLKGANYDEQLAAALETNLISKEEHAQIVVAHAMRMDLINVDDFDTSELTLGNTKAKTAVNKKVAV